MKARRAAQKSGDTLWWNEPAWNLNRLHRSYLNLCARVVLKARRPIIIGVTGSVGKTTTVKLIASVLSNPYTKHLVGTVSSTRGGLNDNVGLPSTILGYDEWARTRLQLARRLLVLPYRSLQLALLQPYARVLVLEYAASADGDVPMLASLARPDIAVVTTVGPAHLERFGTIRRVMQEKAALISAVPESGLVVLGSENPYCAQMTTYARARVMTVPGKGRELAENVARVIGDHFGIAGEQIEARVRAAPAVPRRLQFEELGRVTLIDDSISANPLSMKLGLDALAQAPAGRRIAVLGAMAELGAESAAYHEEVGKWAHERADVIVGIGPHARRYQPHCYFDSVSECMEILPQLLRAGDVILVKGAMTSGMGQIAHVIRRFAGVASDEEQRGTRGSSLASVYGRRMRAPLLVGVASRLRRSLRL